MTLVYMKPLAGMREFIEHCVHMVIIAIYRINPKYLAQAILATRLEKCISDADFRQDFHPIPLEGLRMDIETLLRPGLEEAQISMLIKDDPSRLMET